MKAERKRTFRIFISISFRGGYIFCFTDVERLYFFNYFNEDNIHVTPASWSLMAKCWNIWVWEEAEDNDRNCNSFLNTSAQFPLIYLLVAVTTAWCSSQEFSWIFREWWTTLWIQNISGFFHYRLNWAILSRQSTPW